MTEASIPKVISQGRPLRVRSADGGHHHQRAEAKTQFAADHKEAHPAPHLAPGARADHGRGDRMEPGGAEACQQQQQRGHAKTGRDPHQGDQDARQGRRQDDQQFQILAVRQVADHRLQQVGRSGWHAESKPAWVVLRASF